jgi:phage terminase large subunit-like protein
MVTPNLGRSITLQRLVDECRDEEAKGEGALRTWASQHLNVEIGLALMSNGWAGAEFWERQGKQPGLTLAQLLERCEVVTVGIDGGGLDDLLGLCVLGRVTGTQRWLAWTRAWAHPIALKRRQSEESRYRGLEADGDLKIIEELPGDVSAVAAIVAEVHASGLLASVGMDPEKTHKVMFQALVDVGIPEPICFGISQGWKLVGAMTVAERKLAEGEMEHGAQPLMAWCVSNAKVEPKGNAALITKQASGTGKIDPLMALLNATSLMSLNPAAMVIGEDYELVTA